MALKVSCDPLGITPIRFVRRFWRVLQPSISGSFALDQDDPQTADWLDGPPDAAGLLCRPYPELMVVERTGESWVRR